MASSPSTSIRRLSQAELARELGVSRQAIGKHVAAGTIPMDAAGKIDVDLARRALADRVRPSGKTAAAVQGVAPAAAPASAAPAPAAAAPASDDLAPTSYHVARTLRESEEARMAKLKRLELESKLIEKEPATQAVFTAFRTLRDGAMPLGRRLSAKLATMTDPLEIQLLIDEAMREVLRNFHDRTLASLSTRMGNATPPVQAPDAAA